MTGRGRYPAEERTQAYVTRLTEPSDTKHEAAYCPPMGSVHSPNLFFTNCTHKVLNMGLCEVLVIVVQQFAVGRGHCHKYINPWSFCAQELFPNLEGDRTQHSAEDSTAASHTLPPASTAGLSY